MKKVLNFLAKYNDFMLLINIIGLIFKIDFLIYIGSILFMIGIIYKLRKEPKLLILTFVLELIFLGLLYIIIMGGTYLINNKVFFIR